MNGPIATHISVTPGYVATLEIPFRRRKGHKATWQSRSASSEPRLIISLVKTFDEHQVRASEVGLGEEQVAFVRRY